MRTSRFSEIEKKLSSERLIVSDFICQALDFLDYFDLRDRFELANDEYAEFIIDSMIKWERSRFFSMDVDRCTSIEMFCEENNEELRNELQKGKWY